MNESAWEKSRRSDRKKLLVTLLVLVLLCATGVMLFFNNRDLIGLPSGTSARVQNDIPGNKPDAVAADPLDSSNRSSDISATAQPAADTVAAEHYSADVVSASPASPPPRSETIPPKPSGTSDASPSPGENSCCSVVLPEISCTSENRKDVVINLSLELFFDDIEQRSAILLRREDIKVMVMRTMRDQQLGAVKIHELETLLQKNIMSLFSRSGIIRVTINNIQIEKSAR